MKKMMFFLNFDFKSIQKIKSNELEFFNKHKICHRCHKGKIYNYRFNDFLLTNEWYDFGTTPFSLSDKHCFING